MVVRKAKQRSVAKAATGIEGLDQITSGGLPRGRTTLIAGGAGSGKTLLAMEFLIKGATEYGEPGVCMSFEETGEELIQNLASLGYDVNRLIRQRKLVIDHVHVERREFEETGEYDLEGLFIRLDHAIQSVKAKRVLLDTVEVLFSGLENMAIVRSELRRLFRWLKEKGVSAVVTAETGEGKLTRHGLEEYVADCVVLLDHRVQEQISTRRIRVVKYRGSTHGTNEYPFIIGEHGISVLPITSIGLTYGSPVDRISSGIATLDAALDGQGFYRASSILVSGSAGTGKSIIAARFAEAACQRGERVLYFAFEEAPSQILRNMASVGIRLEPWLKKGLLAFHSERPSSAGLESHLAQMHSDIGTFKPNVAVIDPITNLVAAGEDLQVKSMLTRLIDFLKMQGVTAVFTNLTSDRDEHTPSGISSLMDAWVVLGSAQESAGGREMYVRKARGLAHSSRVHALNISERGIELIAARNGSKPRQGTLHAQSKVTQARR